MSVFPVFGALIVGLLIVSLFMWNVWVLSCVAVLLLLLLIVYLYDIIDVYLHYESGFWLFIASEVLVFGTLIFCCLYFDAWCYENLSSSLELPFLGCFVLLGSSVTVTAFHHLLKWEWSWVFLLFTVILGFGFVVLQLLEMSEVIVNLYDCSFYASSFCTVGLHFIHVVLGAVALAVILIVGAEHFGVYRCSLVTWYWHFVDYVWLFVYTFVYVCYY